MSTINKLLRNYRDLLTKVELICREIEAEYGEYLACHAGCDDCCRHITLFPVEAAALAPAIDNLPREEAARIQSRARRASPDGPCPLLKNGLCLLYDVRPIICRTHGLPLLTMHDGSRSIDFCPRNFHGLSSLPGKAVIDLERLNTALAAVNALFVAERYGAVPRGKERVSIAEALLSSYICAQKEKEREP